MPAKTKRFLNIGICVLFFVGALCLIFGMFSNDKQEKAYAQSTLTNLNDDAVFVNAFGQGDAQFSTISSGEAYDATQNPYAIGSAQDLIRLAYYVDYLKDQTYASASYRLTNHIDLSPYNWRPIGQLGNDNIPFSGVFDGNGYSIFGLTINLFYTLQNNQPTILDTETENAVLLDDSVAGLFGAIKTGATPAKIKLLGLSNTSIHTNAYYTGSVVGLLSGDPLDTNIVMQNSAVSDAVASAVVQECYNTGSVVGGMYVGGIAGYVNDGAVVFNCLNAEAPTQSYEDVVYGENNLTGTVAIYSKMEDANVGGIAGGVEETTTKGVVQSCINTASVGKFANGTNVGGIVGYYPSGSKERYRTNISQRNTVFTSNTSNVAGVSRALGDLKYDFVYTNGNFSIELMNSGQYIPYTRGETPDAIWHKGDAVNNGYPYLTRVNILARVELDVRQTNNITPATVNFYGYDANGNKVSTMDWYKPLVLSGNVFYIEQGKSVPVNSSVLSQYATTFEFLDWQMDAVVSNITDTSRASGVMTADILFVSTDGVYTAVYDYKYYDISLSSNNSLYGSVVYQNPVSDDPSLVDWQNVEVLTNNTIHARINDVVRIIAKPNAGFKLEDITTSNYASYDTIDANTIQIVITTGDLITFNFVSKTYQIDVDVPTDSASTPLAQTEFCVNNGTNQTSVLYAKFNDVIKITTSNIQTNYFFHHYQILPLGAEPFDLAEGVDTFVVQDFDQYVVVPVFTKQTYSIKLNKTSNNFDVVFTNPNTTNILVDIEFDGEFSAQIQNIKEGYHFVRWNLEYLGDSNETWDVLSTTISKQNLSGNVVLTPVVEIDKLSVLLEVEGNGTITNQNITEIDYGLTLSSTATANPGNKFVGWFDSSNNLVTRRASFVVVATQNVQLCAKFEIVLYNVLFGVVADDGTVFSKDVVVQTQKSGEYTFGQDVQFEVVCPNGYVFDEFEMQTDLDASNYEFNQDGTGVLHSVSKDVYIVAKLKLKTFVVKFGINDIRYGDYKFNYQGWTTFSDALMSQEYIYSYKDELQVVVLNQNQSKYPEISKNYAFSYWIVNNNPYDVGSSLTVQVTQDLNIQAFFRPLSYRLVVTKTIPEGANINGLSSDFYDFGDVVNLTANINSGYVFNGWFEYDPVLRQNNLLTQETSVSVSVDKSKNIVCSVSKLGAIIATTGDLSAGSVSGNGEYKVGMRITLVAKPNQDYVFSCWKASDGTLVSRDLSLTVDVLDGTQVFEAVFTPKFNVDIKLNNSKLGSVNINNTDLGNVELVAVANNNCSFVGWAYDDKIISTDTTYNLKLNGDVALKAVFQRDFNWNILIIIGGCILFAVVLLIVAIQYVRSKEAEPLKSTYLLKTADDSAKLTKKKKIKKQDIESIPVRKINPADIEPVPVRKTYTKPSGYVRKDLKDNVKKDEDKK